MSLCGVVCTCNSMENSNGGVRPLAVYSGFLFLASGLFEVSIFSYALDFDKKQ